MTIIYLHAFDEEGETKKGKLLRSHLNCEVITPSISHSPSEAVKQIEALCKSHDEPVLIGISLGGFYADLMNSRLGIPSLLINPLVDTSTVEAYIGENKTVKGSPFTIERKDFEDLMALKEEKDSNKSERRAKQLILLAMNDPLFDVNMTVNEYVRPTQELITTKDGGHRFLKREMFLDSVDRFLKKCLENRDAIRYK